MTEESTQTSQQPVSLNRLLILVLIFVLGAATMYAVLNFDSISQITQAPKTTDEEQPEPPEDIEEEYPGDYTTVIRNFDGEDLKRIKTLSYSESDLETNITPVYDGFEFLYYRKGPVVYQYSLKTKEEKKVYAHTDTSKTFAGMSALPGGFLYISQADIKLNGTEIVPTYGMYDELEVVVIDTLEKPAQRRVIPAIQTTVYGGASYLMTTEKYDVLASFGGDGCGGSGIIYRYAQEIEKILDVGFGCSDGPRYIGAVPDQDSLLLYESIGSYQPEENTGDPIKKLYLYNVNTKEERVLIDFGQENFPVVNAKVSLDGSKVAILFVDQVWEVNLKTGKVLTRVTGSHGLTDIRYYDGSNLFTLQSSYSGLKTSNHIATYKIKERELRVVTPDQLTAERFYGVVILGSYNGQLVVVDTRRNIPYDHEEQSN